MSEPVRPATDEEIAEMRGWKTVMPGGGPNGVGLMVQALLARLDAAEQAAITYSADISNLESARDAALARVAELERLLRPVEEAGE